MTAGQMLTQIYEITSAQEAVAICAIGVDDVEVQLSARATAGLRHRDRRSDTTAGEVVRPLPVLGHPICRPFGARTCPVNHPSGGRPGAGYAGACPRDQARNSWHPSDARGAGGGTREHRHLVGLRANRRLFADRKLPGERQADRGARHHARLEDQPANCRADARSGHTGRRPRRTILQRRSVSCAPPGSTRKRGRTGSLTPRTWTKRGHSSPP